MQKYLNLYLPCYRYWYDTSFTTRSSTCLPFSTFYVVPVTIYLNLLMFNMT